MYSLNKLESYSRISALGPVGHCTSHFKRAVCISCRPCGRPQGGGGSGPCGQGEGVKHVIFFVDVINGWPLWQRIANSGKNMKHLWKTHFMNLFD